MSELLNARIPELPLNSVLKDTYYGVVYNIEDDTTKRFLMSELLASPTTGNFEYLPDTPYNELDVVTFKGQWWQAIDDVDENIAPGTDDTKWISISQSGSGFVFWAAGVYPQDNVFVLFNMNPTGPDDIRMFWLIDPARPFVSSDFLTELAANKWEQLFITSTTPDLEVVRNKGLYDASGGGYPPSTAILKNWEYTVSVAGTLSAGTGVVPPGTILRALVDNPGQTDSNWRVY